MPLVGREFSSESAAKALCSSYAMVDALATRLSRSSRFSRPARGLFSVPEGPTPGSDKQQPAAAEAEEREADDGDLWRADRTAA
jgi:hypothetical protein